MPEPKKNNGEELAASLALDAECGLRGEAGSALVRHVLALMADQEHRQRSLTAKAMAQRYTTVEALLANLISAALHRFNPSRYVSVPFQRSAYTSLGLSCDAMALARDALVVADLIDHVPGFRDEQFLGFMQVGRVTRIRARPDLRDLFDRFGVDRHTVQRRRVSLIRLKDANKDAGPEPASVLGSRSVLQRINARLDLHQIDLPEEAWARLRERADQRMAQKGRRAKKQIDKLSAPYVGDPTAKSLYRVFSREWVRGGRLYGGWWQNISKDERRYLTIDGEPTVEIDFGHVHPSLLYWARGQTLGAKDPYHLPPYSRQLCKATFQRLINGSPAKGGADLKRPTKDGSLPDGIPFETFLEAYKQHLHEVADCFGKDVGLILQFTDSELALAILYAMDRQGIVALPIHDSFMVQQRHEDALRQTMQEVYRSRFDTEPTLKVTMPAQPRAVPQDHY